MSSDDLFGDHDYTPDQKRIIENTHAHWEGLEPLFLRVHALHQSKDPLDSIEIATLSEEVSEALRNTTPEVLMNLVTFLAGQYIAVSQYLIRITGAES